MTRARDIASSNLPITTSVGNVSSTELQYVDGVTSPIQTQLNSSGLVLLSATGIGFNVSTITINNCFSGSYLNYKIIYSAFTNSGSGAAVYFRFNGVTANYTTSAIAINSSGGTSAVAPIGSTITVGYTASTTWNNIELEVNSPNLNLQSPILTRSWNANNVIIGGGADTNSTGRTGFNLTAQAGHTFHYGTVYVYGYRI